MVVGRCIICIALYLITRSIDNPQTPPKQRKYWFSRSCLLSYKWRPPSCRCLQSERGWWFQNEADFLVQCKHIHVVNIPTSCVNRWKLWIAIAITNWQTDPEDDWEDKDACEQGEYVKWLTWGSECGCARHVQTWRPSPRVSLYKWLFLLYKLQFSLRNLKYGVKKKLGSKTPPL